MKKKDLKHKQLVDLEQFYRIKLAEQHALRNLLAALDKRNNSISNYVNLKNKQK